MRMVRQAERSNTTTSAILAAGHKLFGSRGFEATSIDDIAAEAGVAKGAVYHHFKSKEEIFTRVLDDVQARIAAMPPPPALRKIADPLDLMAAAVLHYLNTATAPGIKQILLMDGPAVTGWRKWREIDDRHFGAGAKRALAHVLGPKVRPAELDALTHLLMGMVMEAALICATAPDAKKAARELCAALRKMLEGLRGS
jgi:AcrR family transcriptional regulator